MLIRQAGCHVRIFPKEESKIAIWLMIIELKSQGWGLKRIASHLNALGIPSPGAGTIRTEHGVKQIVSDGSTNAVGINAQRGPSATTIWWMLRLCCGSRRGH